MRYAPHLTDEQIKAIQDDYANSTDSVRTIAVRHRVSRPTVIKHARAAGLSRPRGLPSTEGYRVKVLPAQIPIIEAAARVRQITPESVLRDAIRAMLSDKGILLDNVLDDGVITRFGVQT